MDVFDVDSPFQLALPFAPGRWAVTEGFRWRPRLLSGFGTTFHCPFAQYKTDKARVLPDRSSFLRKRPS